MCIRCASRRYGTRPRWVRSWLMRSSMCASAWSTAALCAKTALGAAIASATPITASAVVTRRRTYDDMDADPWATGGGPVAARICASEDHRRLRAPVWVARPGIGDEDGTGPRLVRLTEVPKGNSPRRPRTTPLSPAMAPRDTNECPRRRRALLRGIGPHQGED